MKHFEKQTDHSSQMDLPDADQFKFLNELSTVSPEIFERIREAKEAQEFARVQTRIEEGARIYGKRTLELDMLQARMLRTPKN